ncbi:hypothetical protein [Pontibacter liquoris]|uniref:hypothetical protein n=1 Tax=Pontibacter liquoris TaxID=2905677 RepID=UPI001FA7FECC|nr:hypothetical protein [Pontibacter liquoris]
MESNVMGRVFGMKDAWAPGCKPAKISYSRKLPRDPSLYLTGKQPFQTQNSFPYLHFLKKLP